MFAARHRAISAANLFKVVASFSRSVLFLLRYENADENKLKNFHLPAQWLCEKFSGYWGKCMHRA